MTGTVKTFFVRVSVIAAVLVLAASCRVHEWPDADTPALLDIDLVFAEEMPDYKEVSYDVRGTKAAFSAEDMDIRCILKFYPGLPDGSFSSVEASDYTLTITRPATEELNCSRRVSLPEGRWQIRCWADYVMTGSTGDLFYKAGDFSSVTLLTKTYVANTDYRDAFRGVAEVALRRVGGSESPAEARLDMERPLAKYRFIATDLDALITRVLREKAAEAAASGKDIPVSDDSSAEPSSALASFNPADYYLRFTYSQFLPYVFDMFRDKPIDSRTGVSFDSEFIQLSEKEALMGFDYVMVNGHESKVSVQVALYECATDKLLSQTPVISVPLVRSKVTTVRGDFLTMGVGGGIGVNPEFDGEYTLIIP